MNNHALSKTECNALRGIAILMIMLYKFVRLFMYEWIDCSKIIIPATILFLLITFVLSWLHHKYIPENKPLRKKPI